MEDLYQTESKLCKDYLEGKIVTLDLDGWSNIHNEPVICASVVTEDKESYLVKTVDTSGHPHDTEYLTKLTKQIVLERTEKFGVKIASFVTDNDANMQAMRRELHNEDDTKLSSLITYGCSAHIANLLAHDLDNQTARNHVVQVIKYIRNNHSAAAQFKKAGGMKLQLPGDTRWNSVSDALESYLKQ